jgi:hypothetical protein
MIQETEDESTERKTKEASRQRVARIQSVFKDAFGLNQDRFYVRIQIGMMILSMSRRYMR